MPLRHEPQSHCQRRSTAVLLVAQAAESSGLNPAQNTGHSYITALERGDVWHVACFQLAKYDTLIYTHTCHCRWFVCLSACASFWCFVVCTSLIFFFAILSVNFCIALIFSCLFFDCVGFCLFYCIFWCTVDCYTKFSEQF